MSPIFSAKCYAAYQIRPNYTALRNTPITTFWPEIRKMETSDGPMGLNMSDEYIYKGGDGNGLDVHLIKNSEWGAVAMLSMSGYGAADGNAQYSTGNYTGVHNLGYDTNWEYTSTLVTKDGNNPDKSNANANTLLTAGMDSRYYDLYYVGNNITTNTQKDDFFGYNYGDGAKIKHYGDAYAEVDKIFNGTGKYNVCPAGPFFERGSSSFGGVFASYYVGGVSSGSSGTRAVVVCAPGL